MEEWNQLQETAIAFFSSWLAICVTPATTRKSFFHQRYRCTRWYEPTPEKTQEILQVLFIRCAKDSFGAECPKDLRQCCKIVVFSCLTLPQEEELLQICNLITRHTGIDCSLW